MGCEVQQVTLCLILVNRFFSRFSVWTWVQSSMFSAVAQTFEVVYVWMPDAHTHAQFIFSLSSDTQESDALIHKSARVIAGSTRGWLKRRGFVWTRGLDCVRMFRGSYNVLMCSLTALEPSFSCFCFRTLVHTGHQQHQSPGLSLRLFSSYSLSHRVVFFMVWRMRARLTSAHVESSAKNLLPVLISTKKIRVLPP